MYLTRFRVNKARRDARHLLASPQAMHAAVMASFPDAPNPTGGPRTLWRLDQNGHQITLYIVSPNRPDLTHLVEQAGWPTTETWLTRPYGDFLNRLAIDQRWAFRLTANPVRDGRPEKDSTGSTKRYGHVTAAQQTQWLLDRAKHHGFVIATGETGTPNLLLHNRGTLSFTRSQGQQPVTLRTATYDGVLEVTDPDALRHVLTAGLGHGKAYGCGLMTLAPAQPGT